MVPCLSKKRSGFALVELLVALGLGTFLLGLLLPAVQKANEAANRVQCHNNLRHVAIAAHNCHDVSRRFPPLTGSFPQGQKNYGTLFFHMLPYLEQNDLYQKAGGFVWQNGTYSARVPTLLCPSDGSAPADNKYKNWLATSSYAGNWLIFGTEGKRFADITDGTSNTLMFAERYQMCNGTPCAWGYPGLYYWAPQFAYYSQGPFQVTPAEGQCDPARAQTPHPGGISVAMADGSAHTFGDKVSPQVWWYLCTPNGNEVVALP
jgi:prepilin-type processing-associated H-X9-DG protein